jgi:hypothetical protein
VRKLRLGYLSPLLAKKGGPTAASSPPSQTMEHWHVTIVHAPGSVEHFYHFLLGFFVPLIFHLFRKWEHAQFRRLIIRSCGPLDLLIRELGDNRIEIIDKDEHRQIVRSTASNSATCTDILMPVKLRFVTIRGCDCPAAYDKRKFARAREALLSIDSIRSEMHSLNDHSPCGNARILLIQRGPSLDFYHSERSERRRSGQERRSIANHEELHQWLRLDHDGCLNVMPEKLTFARQFALFSWADIIIAQHGAALANILWARPSATVIEILPNTLSSDRKDLFRCLARCMGLRYRRVRQDHEHSDVDIEEIREVVKEAIAAPAYRVMSRLRSTGFKIFGPAIPMRHLASPLYRVPPRGLGLESSPSKTTRSRRRA